MENVITAISQIHNAGVCISDVVSDLAIGDTKINVFSPIYEGMFGSRTGDSVFPQRHFIRPAERVRVLDCLSSHGKVDMSYVLLQGKDSQFEAKITGGIANSRLVVSVFDMNSARENIISRLETENKSLLEKLIKVENMFADVTSSAGGLAHDLNNMITPFTPLLDLIKNLKQEELSSNYQDINLLKRITPLAIGSYERITEQAQLLLDLSLLRNSSNQDNFNLGVFFSDFVSKFQGTYDEKNVKFNFYYNKKNVSSNSLLTSMSRPDLASVIENLVGNALKFLPCENGEISFDLYDSNYLYGKSLPYYYLYVQNNGSKIPNEIRGRIFTENFSESGSYGMGLYHSFLLMSTNKGGIWLEKSDEDVTSFGLTIPRLN